MKLLAVSVVALLAVIRTETDAAEQSIIFGPGTASCGTWSQYDKQPDNPVKAALQSWVLGFVTGMESGAQLPPAIFKGIDNRGLLGWVSNYCQAHPLDQVSVAAVSLLNELMARGMPKADR